MLALTFSVSTVMKATEWVTAREWLFFSEAADFAVPAERLRSRQPGGVADDVLTVETDGTATARFTKHVDPEQIRRAAEEDHRRAAGERERDP